MTAKSFGARTAVVCSRGMAIELSKPGASGLLPAVLAVREWQAEGAPRQLHPGDVGWYWRFGVEATAAATRTWCRDGRILAVGLLDGEDLLRLTTAPGARQDEELAQQLADDIADPAVGVLPAGQVFVEAPEDALIHDLLGERGWPTADPWTPLRRDLSQPVDDPGLRIEVTGPGNVSDRVAVQRAAFDNSSFTDELWRHMADGPAYAEARCLVAYDDQDNAVATVTVWSAGPGLPGLLEPMGVHREHRGHGRRQGDLDRSRGGPSGDGLVQRLRLHAELQRRRCRDLSGSRLSSTSGGL